MRGRRRAVIGALFFMLVQALVGCRVGSTMPQLGAAWPGERVVSLTFDDGPSPYTPLILDILDRHGVKATFFVVGQQAARYPGLIDEIRRRGHTIANHSWSHPDFRRISRGQLANELDATSRLLRSRGIGPTCVRPPYGATNLRINHEITRRGYDVVMWSIDSDDWRRPGVGRIAHNVLSRVHPGGVVLFHDGGGNRSQTAAALDTIIRGIKARRYQFRPVCGPRPAPQPTTTRPAPTTTRPAPTTTRPAPTTTRPAPTTTTPTTMPTGTTSSTTTPSTSEVPPTTGPGVEAT